MHRAERFKAKFYFFNNEQMRGAGKAEDRKAENEIIARKT